MAVTIFIVMSFLLTRQTNSYPVPTFGTEAATWRHTPLKSSWNEPKEIQYGSPIVMSNLDHAWFLKKRRDPLKKYSRREGGIIPNFDSRLGQEIQGIVKKEVSQRSKRYKRDNEDPSLNDKGGLPTVVVFSPNSELDTADSSLGSDVYSLYVMLMVLVAMVLVSAFILGYLYYAFEVATERAELLAAEVGTMQLQSQITEESDEYPSDREFSPVGSLAEQLSEVLTGNGSV